MAARHIAGSQCSTDGCCLSHMLLLSDPMPKRKRLRVKTSCPPWRQQQIDVHAWISTWPRLPALDKCFGVLNGASAIDYPIKHKRAISNHLCCKDALFDPEHRSDWYPLRADIAKTEFAYPSTKCLGGGCLSFSCRWHQHLSLMLNRS